MEQSACTRAEVLAENLFSLADPWRGRFLTFVAERALGQAWDGQLPTKNEVVTWLDRDNLRRTVASLVSNWEGASAYQHDSEQALGAL
jgi:hypothetical protein